jgi:hypothetical protein
MCLSTHSYANACDVLAGKVMGIPDQNATHIASGYGCFVFTQVFDEDLPSGPRNSCWLRAVTIDDSINRDPQNMVLHVMLTLDASEANKIIIIDSFMRA